MTNHVVTDAEVEAARKWHLENVRWVMSNYDRIFGMLTAAAASRPIQGDGWRPIATAPKNATELLLLVPRGASHGWPTTMRMVGHWASDLSGSEQPSFQGWFRDTGFGFAEINPPPTHWAPLNPELPERAPFRSTPFPAASVPVGRGSSHE